MTRTALEDAVFAWVDGVLNPPPPPPEDPENPPPDPPVIPIIWADRSGPTPAEAYVTLKIVTDTQQGQVNKSAVRITGTEEEGNLRGTQTLRTNRDMALSIQGFGEGSVEYLEALRGSTDREDGLALLAAGDFAVRDVGDVTDISEVTDEQTERRFVLDVILGRAVVDTQEPGWITNVEYEGSTS